ncbi:MAG: MFS transporter [Mycobacteriales bacterium]
MSDAPEKAAEPVAPALERSNGRWARLRRVLADTEALRYPDYRRLFIGNAVSFVGIQLTGVAVPVQMWQITHSSSWVGLLGMAALIPLIGFGLWGGAVADAVDRRRLLLGSQLLAWVVTLLLFVQALAHADSPPLLLSLIAVQSAAFAVASPTRSAIIPRLLPLRVVPAANTLSFTASSLSAFIGPLLAGVVLARWSYGAAYAIDASLFTVAMYATLRLPQLEPTGERATRPGLRSVVQGLAYIGVRPVLAMSFVADLIAMVLANPRALYPEMADRRFGGEHAVGWLYASIALGAVAGGLFSGWVSRVRRQGMAITASIAVWGLAVAFAGFAHALWLVVLLLAASGAADLVSATFRQTILQVYAPDEMRGRLQGVFIVTVAGGPRLGDLRAGAMGAALGASTAWIAGGFACAVVMVLVAFLVPTFLRYDAAAPEPAEAATDTAG